MIIILFVALIIGWLCGVAVNHAANVLPLRESLFQRPFCKRRLDVTVTEFISIAEQGSEAAIEHPPSYCHTPKPVSQWSALIAALTGNNVCQSCGKSFGLRPVLVELALPLLFLFLAARYGLSIYLLFLLLYTVILMLLLVTDLEHRLIQNVVILPAILLAMVGATVTPDFSWQQAFLGGAAGFLVFYLLALLARGGLGSGDVTLSAFLGLITAFPNVILSILLGIFLGGIGSGLLVLTRRVTMKTFIPYGPFLMVAGWVVLIWGEELFARFWG